MLLLAGALLSAFFGYKLLGWWVPALVACIVLAMQAVSYQGVLSNAGSLNGFIQILAISGLMSLLMFYATFSMGRSLGLRRRKKAR